MSDEDYKLSPESEFGIKHGLTFSEDDTSYITGDMLGGKKRSTRVCKDEIAYLRRVGLGVCQLSDAALINIDKEQVYDSFRSIYKFFIK